MKRPLTVGHRGASALAPENSLRAFELAIEHRLDMAELDVHLSRDGELMVIHDPDLSRMAGRQVAIAEPMAAELTEIDVGAGQRVSRLRDGLDLARGRLGLYVELNGKGTGEALGQLVRRGETCGVELIAGSFDKPQQYHSPRRCPPRRRNRPGRRHRDGSLHRR